MVAEPVMAAAIVMVVEPVMAAGTVMVAEPAMAAAARAHRRDPGRGAREAVLALRRVAVRVAREEAVHPVPPPPAVPV
jgi:site-specific recombinase